LQIGCDRKDHQRPNYNKQPTINHSSKAASEPTNA